MKYEYFVSMIRFYAPEIENELLLPDSDSAHCCRVLRMKEGDKIEVVDGKGSCYECVITDANPRMTRINIVSRREIPDNFIQRIVLAVAPPKNIDRMEWLVEKAVEIGVSEIIPVRCARSERKDLKTGRLEKIMVSAMKQSLKARLPELREMTDFRSFVDQTTTDQKVVGYCSETIERIDFSTLYKKESSITIFIGPEGDFTPEEIDYCIAGGFVPVTFGNSRLRTETAALYGLTAVHVLDHKR